jgi:hypothetical protein
MVLLLTLRQLSAERCTDSKWLNLAGTSLAVEDVSKIALIASRM